jgi:hypothetical protein
MALESATYVSGLVDTNPAGSDSISQGDDHLKLIKSVLQSTLPNANAALNGVHTGTVAPTSTSAGQLWFDTSGAGVLKVRDKADSAYDNVDTTSTALPTGIISLWYGSIASIPSGWSLCNGDGDTPDLRDSFIIGAGTGATYAVDATAAMGDTGSYAGHNTGAHTLTTAEMPAHTHEVKIRGYTGEVQSAGAGDYTDEGGLQDSEPTGGGGTHEHTGGGAHVHTGSLPPYYALCYIMKT